VFDYILLILIIILIIRIFKHIRTQHSLQIFRLPFSGFPIQPSSDLFIITSYTKILTLHASFDVSFPCNRRRKNLL